MITVDSQTLAALEAGTLVPRDFLWIEPRDRDTGARVGVGFWSDLGAVDVTVTGIGDGLSAVRTYRGAGALIEISDVPRVSGLVVQQVMIRLNQINPDVESAIRGYDVRFAPVELHRGFLDPGSRLLVAALMARFYGFVDNVTVTTPEAGGEGQVQLTCASFAQELTRTSAAKRSDADQRLRNPSDAFYRDTASVGTWQVAWGQAQP